MSGKPLAAQGDKSEQRPSYARRAPVHGQMSGPLGLFGELFADAQMAALLDDRASLQAMLDMEAALARAQVGLGLIPDSALAGITEACRAELYDIAEIGRQTSLAGNPAIPLVKALTGFVAASDADAAKWVHFGATSQDIIDSGRSLQIAAAARLLRDRLARLATALAGQAERHRLTVMPGRTFLQQAVPVSFGLKAAQWLGAVCDSDRALAPYGQPQLQFGGAAGTLASLGDKGAVLALALAATAPFAGSDWLASHTARGRIGRLGSELAIATTTLGKIARDVTLMMQTETAEAFEPSAPGKGGSSTMPHKRNPVLCTAILACAARVPGLASTLIAAGVQEHERAVGNWHAEWEPLFDLLRLTGAALNHAIMLVEGLEIDATRMRANLDLTHGLVMAERATFALAASLGKAEAHHRVEAATKVAIRDQRHLREVLAQDAVIAAKLDAAALDAIFDPAGYLGATEAMIDAHLARYRDQFTP